MVSSSSEVSFGCRQEILLTARHSVRGCGEVMVGGLPWVDGGYPLSPRHIQSTDFLRTVISSFTDFFRASLLLLRFTGGGGGLRPEAFPFFVVPTFSMLLWPDGGSLDNSSGRAYSMCVHSTVCVCYVCVCVCACVRAHVFICIQN